MERVRTAADGRIPSPGAPAGALVRALLLVLLSVPPLHAQEPGDRGAEAAARARSTLEREIRGILPLQSWPRSYWGVLAISLDRGDTLVATDPDLPLAPASNVKILSSAAALHALGPDYRFSTIVLADGPVEDGTLQGDLILYGTGDPSISSTLLASADSVMGALAARVREAGIRRIRGDVVGDASFFGGPERAEGWNPRDYNDAFAAPVSALSYNENVASVRVTRVEGQSRPRAVLLPSTAPLPIRNEVRIAPGRTSVILHRDSTSATIRLTGTLSTRSRELWRELTVTDPPLFAANALLAALEREGVRVEGRPRPLRARDASRITGTRSWAPAFGHAGPRTVAVHHSPPLTEILRVVNHRSNNLFAEAVTQALGRVVEGEGSFAGGTRAVERFVEEQAEVPEGMVKLYDGSGLSRHNRAPASAFVQVLRTMASSDLGDAFLATLPEAGGNSLRRMRRTAASGNLRAKTGTIEGVSALSGLVRSADGERILFSILANSVPSTGAAKRFEDRIGIRLAQIRRGGSALAEGASTAR